MYKKKYFWLVGTLTGFFLGMLVFLLQLLLFNLAISSFSPFYVLIYLLPFFGMYHAARRLREGYGLGVLHFSQGFRIAMLTGFVSAVVMSLMMYYVYSNLFIPALQQRASQLHAELLATDVTKTFDSMKERKQLITKLLSPMSLSVYYFAVNIVLLPLFAFLIAIFARRSRRDITDL